MPLLRFYELPALLRLLTCLTKLGFYLRSARSRSQIRGPFDSLALRWLTRGMMSLTVLRTVLLML